MTGVLKNIQQALSLTVSNFRAMQQTASSAVPAAQWDAVQERLNQAGVAIRKAEEQQKGFNQISGELPPKIKDAADKQLLLNRTMQAGNAPASALLSTVKGLAGAYLGFAGIRKAVNFTNDALSFANVQNEAEAKLRTVMNQRMGAGEAEFQAVMDTTALQQSIGVIGDEVQLMGGQQLATFLNSTEALNTLIPAMNNLAVQQNGVNVTTENMTSIGNLMGKAMQGQTAALTRVGITFDEAQEKVLKYGTEMERATVLAQVITDNVGKMNEVIRGTPAGELAAISNTFGDIKEEVGRRLYPAVLKLFQIINENMPSVKAVMIGVANIISGITDILASVAEAALWIVRVVQDNWPKICPVIWTLVGALTAYNLALAAGNLLSETGALMQVWKTACNWAETAAIFAMIVAQNGLNAALLACPLSWTIMLILLVAAAIYGLVAAVNHFSKNGLSAIGVINGAFSVMLAFLQNQILIPIWNGFAELVNFLGNVFNDPVAAIKILFYEMAQDVIGSILTMAKGIESIINQLPGMKLSITGSLQTLFDGLGRDAQKIKDVSGWKEYIKRKEYVDYVDAAKNGYEIGKGIEDNLSGLFNPESWLPKDMGIGQNAEQALEKTAANTAKIADSMDMAEEDLKWMRDIAVRDAVNRFTTAEIKVDMGGVNNIVNSEMDIDGIADYLGDVVFEQMSAAAEGVRM